jgi:hypothetical protein
MRIFRWLFILLGVLFIGGIWYYFSQQNASRDAVDASTTYSSAIQADSAFTLDRECAHRAFDRKGGSIDTEIIISSNLAWPNLVTVPWSKIIQYPSLLQRDLA